MVKKLNTHVKSEKEQWSFPRKIDVFKELGIAAPSILERINRKRNQFEHEYKMPTREEVDDAVDVACLFCLYTDRLYYKGQPINELHKRLDPHDPSKILYSFKLERASRTISVEQNGNVSNVKTGSEDKRFEFAKIIVEWKKTCSNI